MASPRSAARSRKRVSYDENAEFDPDDIISDGESDSEFSISSSDDEISSGLSSSEGEDSSSDEDDLGPIRQWVDVTNAEDRAPPRFPFTGSPGRTFDFDENCTPLNVFEKFFDKELTGKIACETNRFAQQVIAKQELGPRSRVHQWSPTNDNEIKVFIGIVMLQGIISKPAFPLYWSKRSVLETPIFAKVMPRNRFTLLMKFLHFSDNEEEQTGVNPKLRKIYDIMETLRIKFCNFYQPQRDLSVDESLLLYKGNLSWKQYIPIKRARFGIKFFMVCEAKSGYIADFLIYTGSTTVYNDKYTEYSLSTKVVLHLMDRFLGKGYCVTVDNYYMSPQLSDLLVAQKTDIYGTLRKNRKDLPSTFRTKKLKKGEIAAYRRGKVLALKWQDKKEVCLISTVHNTSKETVKTKRNEEIQKPKLVIDYNLTMGGVDRADQLMSFHPTTRKRQKKYYKKIFFHLMDKSLWNAFILYSQTCEKQIDFLEFRLLVVEEIFQSYSVPRQESKGRPSTSQDNPLRLTARHFPKHIPPNPGKAAPLRKCKVCCSKKDPSGKRVRKETRVWCQECDVGLCMEPCFEAYHTKRNY